MMMRIFHASGSILTGTDLGEALLLYSNALSVRRQNDTVEIPVLDDRGRATHAVVVIGYGSPVVGAPVRAVGAELVDPDSIDVLYRRARDVHAQMVDSKRAR